MKVLLILLTLIICVYNQSTQFCTGSSIALYFSFNTGTNFSENSILKTRDVSFNGNHGTLLNGAKIGTQGVCDTPASFPNTNSYLQIDSNSALVPGTYYSITFW
jgi:hypothetical protein